MVAQNNDNRAVILEQALTRFVDECLQGDKPNIDEFVRQYPQCETQLKRRIRDLKEIDFLFDSLFRADEVEFGATTAPQDLVGQKLASFDVERVIGQGGMGVVYLARDTKLDRQVAIKSMPAGLLSSSKAQARFKSEAKLLASLNHPNIAVIYDIIEDQEGSSYLVLEYVPGETLAERIARDPLELEEALSISSQITEAVSAAHKKDIIHRDLKPSNIKITPEGRVKVLDFGLAKTYDRNSKGSKTDAIQPGRVIGTPAYMSPEQAQGKETDGRTDIWSFGCIMFEMLTGRHPFECETAKDTLQSIIKHQPDWNLLPESIPTNIRALLKRCLDKDPSRRHENITNASIEISNTLTKLVTSLVETVHTRLRRMRMVMGMIGVIFLIGAVMWFGLNKVNESSAKVIRLVVLPFENLGSANDGDYSSVISAGIISHLVGVRGLAVSSEKMTDERAILLGKKSSINYVLKGTIQCVQGSDPNNRVVRIRPQLIRISDGQYVWAKPYDKNVSQIYRIPSELAEEVAYAMNIALRDSERQAIASLPTKNKEAYAYYLRGNYYSSQPYQIKSNLRNAVRLYEKAVGLDDRFALAYAKLSQAYSGMYRFEDRSEKRLAMAKKAVDKALALDPKLPEIHWALGFYYYWGYRECNQALKHFAVARKGRPNDSRLIAAMAYAQRAQGKLDQALINIREAHELSPIDPVFATELGKTLMDMRKYEEAAHYCKRAIELGPDQPNAYEWMASIYLRQKGDTKKSHDILEDALRHIKSIDDRGDIVYLLGTIEIYEGNYQEALDRLNVESEDIETMDYNKALRCARIYRYLNEEDRARKYFESAQKNIEKRINENSGNYWLYSHLGIAYAGLGLKEEAVQMGKRATQAVPITRNAWRGTYPIEFLANIYMMVGDYDAALDQIQYLLSVPARLSINILKLDPAWKPLYNHHRFKKLIEQQN